MLPFLGDEPLHLAGATFGAITVVGGSALHLATRRASSRAVERARPVPPVTRRESQASTIRRIVGMVLPAAAAMAVLTAFGDIAPAVIAGVPTAAALWMLLAERRLSRWERSQEVTVLGAVRGLSASVTSGAERPL